MKDSGSEISFSSLSTPSPFNKPFYTFNQKEHMTHNLKSDGPGLFKTKKLKMKNSTSL